MSARNLLSVGLLTLILGAFNGVTVADGVNTHSNGIGLGHTSHGNGHGYGHHKDETSGNNPDDSDGDGVNNDTDQCPGTPAGAEVNAAGCDAGADNIAECQANEYGESNSYQVLITSPADGKQISFQVLEPTTINCEDIGNAAHPLVLRGHGFGGDRNDASFGALRDAGYTVISIDQRGHGDTQGTIRVMDPRVEGINLVAILDWAEKNLEYLAWRNETTGSSMSRPFSQSSTAGGNNLVVGAVGGSYGGGYQLLILATDEKNRLDALVPDITWHDLRYSLNPGDTVKTGWDLALTAAGEAASQGAGFENQWPASDRGLDPFVKDTLIRGGSTNEFPRDALDWFNYNSLGFWCGNQGLPTMPYKQVRWATDPNAMFDVHSTEIPPAQGGVVRTLPKVDVMLTQGFRDTLFNFNDAWWNYQCLSALGGDVHLLTHQSGHILPVASPDGSQPSNYVEGVPFIIPGFQDAGGAQACGNTNLNTTSSDTVLNWFDSKLRGGDAFTRNGDVCVSLADGDSTDIAPEDFLAPGGDEDNFSHFDIAPVEVANGAAAEATVTNGPVVVELGTIRGSGGAVLAGIPNVSLTLASLSGVIDSTCNPPLVPTLRTGCDAIIGVGIGHLRAGTGYWDLVDDQIFPLRGLGEHNVDINGIAERLGEGDRIALLLYGWHAQFPLSFSRDNTLPAVVVSGSINVPIYAVTGSGDLNAAAAASAITPAGAGGGIGSLLQ